MFRRKSHAKENPSTSLQRRVSTFLSLQISEETEFKLICIASLVLINIVLVFSISLSRNEGNQGNIHPHNHRRSTLYLTSTAVATSEFAKLIISILLEHYNIFSTSHSPPLQIFNPENIQISSRKIKNTVLHLDTLQIGVPGILYVVENNLLFIALSNLPVTVFEVTDQLKILTTAFFSVILLNKNLSRRQYLALCLLFSGVVIVELSATSHTSSSTPDTQNFHLGFLSLLLCVFISGFAGVFFEKTIKKTPTVSIYCRNIQLAIYGVCFGLLTVVFSADDIVEEFGFFQNYTLMTWIVILSQAISGIVNALVIRHGDNILKGFAASLATVLATVISAQMANEELPASFATGSLVVICSIFLYSRG